MSISKFIEYLELEKKYAKHTVVAYQADIMAFVSFFEEKYGAIAIETAHYSQVRSWIVELVSKELSNRTINRKVSSLKAYYKFLLKTDQISKTPLAQHKPLKVARALQIPFSVSEVDTVLDALLEGSDFKSVRDRAIVLLFYATGIRRIELVDLKISDVDLGRGQIKVVGKRNKERYVPVLPTAIDAIKSYLKIRATVIADQKGVEALFVTRKGVKIYETLVYRVINTYFSRASTKAKTSPHILRHTFATHLLNEGANLNAVKELLGHSSLSATQVYTHHSVTQLSKVYKNAHPRNKK